jgi:hypothetical protein
VKLRELIDPVEDQVGIYPLDDWAVHGVAVFGLRVMEERQDFGSSREPASTEVR